MRHDELADMFNIIKYTESIGRPECIVPSSRLIKGVLEIMKNGGYIRDYETIVESAKPRLKVKLMGRINDCNIVRPRFSMGMKEFIKWEKKFLPADNIGLLIITTPKGITNQKEARKAGTGGKILGYVY